MKKSLLALCFLSLTSCATIYFDNGSYASRPRPGEEDTVWHHTVALGLLEYSEPIDLRRACPGSDWGYIKTSKQWPQVVLTVLGAGGIIYSPWEVEYICSAR